MRKPVLLWAFSISLAAAAGASATTCNIDFIATPPQTAYDMALLLPNTHATLTAIYNGTPGTDDLFSASAVTYPAGGTLLHWSMPHTPITSGTRIHVGWTTTDNTCPPCITGYFTDQVSNQIPNSSFSVLVVDHATGGSGHFTNLCLIPLAITNIRGACLTTPVPLPGLNSTNSSLVAQLHPLSSGTTIPPNGQLSFPLPPSSGGTCTYVFNYTITGQSNAQISPWVEIP
jgi:hypothetical protein